VGAVGRCSQAGGVEVCLTERVSVVVVAAAAAVVVVFGDEDVGAIGGILGEFELLKLQFLELLSLLAFRSDELFLGSPCE
jgi:hypothetical protein